ncbi:hypothetical protein F3K24_09225 [Streptomyces sp. LBUM 1485]|nr:hypothetical protein [Streptomyces sp. LBUM 1485]
MKRIPRVAKVRAWTSQESSEKKAWKSKGGKRAAKSKDAVKRIEHILVFDTETTTDKEQRLNFGSAMYMAVGKDGKFHATGEYLIYADDLPERDPEGFAVLQDYVLRGHPVIRGKHAPDGKRTMHDWERQGIPESLRGPELLKNSLMMYPPNEFSSHVNFMDVIRAHVEREPVPELQLISQTDFNYEVLQYAAFPGASWGSNKAATVVGFNLPFDLSRIALGVGKARKNFSGGFSFKMREDAKNADIRSVKRGIKGAMFSYTGNRKMADAFTDVGTLGFGLTNNSYTLANAAKAFGVDQRKMATEEHGRITLDYIHYCRQDVRTTAAVYVALVNELDRHPIDLEDSRVFSPASVAKAYLDAMGIPKPLEKQPDFPNEILGYSMTTFYGGRAEAHIRKVPVPVEHVDVTSMYPTVNALMGLWDLLTANRIAVREETEDVRKLVEEISIDELFNQDRWPEFRGIVEIVPDDNLLPVRSAFRLGASETIGISYVTSDRAMWWSLPDIINAKINGGKVPRILRAFRFYPDDGQVDSLKPVNLGGDIPIDPSKDDFFRLVIEQKQAAGQRHTGGDKSHCLCEGCRNKQFLKVLANAGGYGIFVEINREDDKEESEETIYGAKDAAWDMKVYKPEMPGAYCFPPIGTLITGAARLILGMLEKMVTDAGGTWAMCDTDSMAIVASRNGGYIAPEPAVPPRNVEKSYPEAIPVLTYGKVEEIRKRFDSLSPYNPEVAGPIPILKRELPESFDDPQVYCYAISAKRYAMFNINDDGSIEIVTNKEHGLGQYMNPEDPAIREERGTREWVRDIWRYIILTDAGRHVEEPYWFSRPVMSRVSVSTWSAYENLRHWNEGKPYAEQIKPHGFMMAPVASNAHVLGGIKGFRLMGEFNTNSDEWESMDFHNIHDPNSPGYRISTKVDDELLAFGDSSIIEVKSYGQIVGAYSSHPEEKFCDSQGEICGMFTRGILHRHHVDIVTFGHQGKETNHLEEQNSGTLLKGMRVVTEYGTGESEFQAFVVPVLRSLTQKKLVEILKSEGVNSTVRRLRDVLNGSSEPRDDLKAALIRIAVRQAVSDMGDNLPHSVWKSFPIALRDWVEVCASWIGRKK